MSEVDKRPAASARWADDGAASGGGRREPSRRGGHRRSLASLIEGPFRDWS
jgi:hypothetical protein